MKSLVIWAAKKYALGAIQDAVTAKKENVAAWSKKIGVWLGKIRIVTAYLERLAERLSDGALTDEEADKCIAEAEVLAGEVLS